MLHQACYRTSGSCKTILIDIGSYDPLDHSHIDISRSQVLSVLSDDVLHLSYRDTALETTSRAFTATLARLYAEGGVISAGGSGNTYAPQHSATPFPSVFQRSWRPPWRRETLFHQVDEIDMTTMYAVVDIAGMNALLLHDIEQRCPIPAQSQARCQSPKTAHHCNHVWSPSHASR